MQNNTSKEGYFLQKGDNFNGLGVENVSPSEIIFASNNEEKYSLAISTVFNATPLNAPPRARGRGGGGGGGRGTFESRLSTQATDSSAGGDSSIQGRMSGFINNMPPQMLDRILSSPAVIDRLIGALGNPGQNNADNPGGEE